jgi:hypothetical protein
VSTRAGLDALLAEQIAYYRALAGEYEQHALPFAGGDELAAPEMLAISRRRISDSPVRWIEVFIDDAYRTPEELVGGESSSVIERRLLDGSAHRAVKVAHTPDGLQRRLASFGWDIAVQSTAGGPFFWGAGRPGGSPCGSCGGRGCS